MRFGKRADSDFQAEIEAHIHLEEDRLLAEGMSPDEAQAAARRAFGNVAIIRERFYESQRWLWLEQLRQDLRYGMRSLLKAPAFTATAALTIALGVGANTTVFSLFDAVLLQSLPVQNPKELVFLENAGSAGASGAPPYPCFARLRAETGSFAGMAAFASDESRIEIDDKPEQVMGQVASGNYFEVLGIRPGLGRLMVTEDEKLSPPVAVISDRYWRRRFGGDTAVVGRTMSIRGQAFTIIGVTPPEFHGIQPGTPIDVTLPITQAGSILGDPGAWWLHGIVARLKPEVSTDRAQAESDVVFQSFMSGSRYPAELIKKHFHHLEVGPAAQGMDVLRRRFSKPLHALMGIVGLVLMMATANIANLLLARGISRRREFDIRLATGASGSRLVRQLLTETILLFGLGAVPGVVIAGWGVGVIQGLFAQGRRAIALQADLNWRVLAFTIAVTLAAGLLSGMFPAWRAVRTSRGSEALRHALVGLQVALSLVLVVAAVTFTRSLANLRNVSPGFQSEQVLTMSIQLPQGHVEAGKSGAIWSDVLEAVRRIPGVRAAGLASYTPLSGRDRGAAVQIPGYEPAGFEDSSIHVNQVSEGYFETLGIALARGRLLTARDAEGAAKVVLINDSAAKKYFLGRDPIGQTLRFPRKGTADRVYQIAGVIRDTKHMDLRKPAPPFAFIPIRQAKDAERRITLAVASAQGQAALLQSIRTTVAGTEREALISDVITLRTQLDTTLLTERLLSGLSGAFGGLALVLASIGLYGVLSYRIGQQRQSFGIRMALGASPASVVTSVLGQSGLVVAAGLICGLPFAFLAARAADSMLWGVKSSDPAVYIAGVALLSAVGLVSAYLPARRASRITPSEALRQS